MAKTKFLVTMREAEEGGYTVEVPALPGCISEGENFDEALANIREAIEVYLDDVEEDLNPRARVHITEVEVELPTAQPAHG